jgi:hypothetical protein
VDAINLLALVVFVALIAIAWRVWSANDSDA